MITELLLKERGITLEPHKRYKVKGMVMHFWRYRDEDGTPEFYYYAGFGKTLHLIYYWDRDLRKQDISDFKAPMIPKLSTTNQQVVNN